MPKKLVKRRKKKVKRRKHYLDVAPLQYAPSTVYVVKQTGKIVGVDGQGLGRHRLFVLNAATLLSDVVSHVKDILGENSKFEIEQIISGSFYIEPTCLYSYCNLDGRVFNHDLEVVRTGRR